MLDSCPTPPVVSVVMSVYNACDQVGDAINSVLMQSYSNFELLIVDDGSSDGTGAMLQFFANKDSRIRIFSQTNKGLPVALNWGIREAQGEFIARQDADDIWLDNKLEVQMEFLREHDNVDVLGTDCEVVSGEGDGPILFKLMSPNPWFGTPFAHSTVVIRKTALEKLNVSRNGEAYYDPRLRFAQDLDLWYRLYRGNNFARIPRIMVRHLQGRARNLIKLQVYPLYCRLVHEIAKAPAEEREDIFQRHLSEIHSREHGYSESFKNQRSLVEEALRLAHHRRWLEFALRVGEKPLASRHAKALRQHPSVRGWRDKGLIHLASLPGWMSSSVLISQMYVRYVLRCARMSFNIILSKQKWMYKVESS